MNFQRVCRTPKDSDCMNSLHDGLRVILMDVQTPGSRLDFPAEEFAGLAPLLFLCCPSGRLWQS
jgi:hypothetical protein